MSRTMERLHEECDRWRKLHARSEAELIALRREFAHERADLTERLEAESSRRVTLERELQIAQHHLRRLQEQLAFFRREDQGKPLARPIPIR